MSTPKEALDALRVTNPERYNQIVARQKRYAFTPHSPGQAAVLNSRARFKVVRAGRRYGKTKLAAREIVRRAVRNPDTVVWWVANTYKNVRRGYREVLRQLPPQFLAKPAPPATANDLILQLKNGTRIEFYSGTNPDAMAGEGVSYVVVDEAALQSEIVWTQTIRPTLMDFGGGALLISTPRGRNWFWQLARRGEDELFPDYESFHFTTADNPLIDASEVDEARRTLPEVVFKQEILAEFIAGSAGIFRFDDAVILPTPVEIQKGDQLVMGLDLAKHEDFTVITAVRVSDHMPVYHDRFNDLSWPTQRDEVFQVEEKLRKLGAENVTIMVDATGIGDVIFDDLDLAGLDVVPIKFSQQWKNQAVKLLASDLEQGNAVILERQVPEFEAYEYRITEAGRFIYSAPEGGHDDEVSAKLLEHWGLVHETMTDGVTVLDTSTKPSAEEEAAIEQEDAEEVSLTERTMEDLMNDPSVWGR